MTFLLQIKKKTDATFDKGTSNFETEKEALTQLYIAMSSAMSKENTQSILCLLTDEYGTIKKKEYWYAPIVVEDKIVDEEGVTE